MDYSVLNTFTENLKKMPEGILPWRYISWVNEKINSKYSLFSEKYAEIVESEENHRVLERPFLSVVTRTQGRRPEFLRETLLCLSAQKDQNFEVIIIGHKMDEEQERLVKEIIDEQSYFLREKIRYFPLNHGNRTTPLNFGFAHARGEYIAVLDDDDLVLDNWVSAFKKGAEKRKGALIHSGCLVQKWMAVKTDSSQVFGRAVEGPDYTYIKDFNIHEQLKNNYCPISGMAFPSYLFQKIGITFDEFLTTTEDWDYIMSTAILVGVEDVHEITSVWRIWENIESSRTVHDKLEWDRNRNYVRLKFKNVPIVAYVSASDLPDTLPSSKDEEWICKLPKNMSAALYIDYGKGYSQDEVISGRFYSNGSKFDSLFCIPENSKYQNIGSIRFDPGEDGRILLQNITAIFHYTDESQEIRDLKDTSTNGKIKNNRILFHNNDPWIIWRKIKKPLRSVRVFGEIKVDIEV